MKITLVLALLALTVVMTAEAWWGGKEKQDYTKDGADDLDDDGDGDDFDDAKDQCEAALGSSCDLDALNELAGQLDNFEEDPTSAEARDIVAQHGGLNNFCRKAVELFQCILEVADGDECASYRQYSGIDEAIDDIRHGFNELVEKCPRELKKMHRLVKKFLKHYK
jgi:hypothetical protein